MVGPRLPQQVSRRQVLAGSSTLVAASALPKTLFARPRLSYDLTPKPIANGIWMIEGSTEYFSTENGGAIVNCILIETKGGMVIVDTGPSLRYGVALRKLAEEISPRGVAGVIISHHHPDHFFGNQAFDGIPLWSLAETRQLAQTHGDGFSDNMYRLLGDWMRGTEVIPPTHDLSPGEFEIVGRRFEAIPLSGHTEADLALLDVQTGTLIAGDLVFYNRAPTTPSADMQLWHQSLDILEGIDAKQIIPGHGPVDTTNAAIPQTRAYLTWLQNTLEQAAKDGLDMVEIMYQPLPADYASMGSMPQEFHRSVSHLYPAIEVATYPLSSSL